MKLGLGTVQFGLNYGISNSSGKTPLSEIEKIVSFAQEVGIRVLDTAPFYGESESLLGRVLPSNCDFRIVTKVQKIGKERIIYSDAENLKQSFFASLAHLRRSSVYGLLIHHSEDLLSKEGHLLFEAMTALQSEGRIEKIGVSCYSRHQINQIVAIYPIQLLQIPLNILDQRLIEDGYLETLKSKGIEVHARSIFLQGLLLMDPRRLPSHFGPVQEHLKRFHGDIALASLSPLQACLSFGLERQEISTIICGVNSFDQLTEIVRCVRTTEGPVRFDFSRYGIHQDEILSPTQWPKDKP